MRLVATCTPGSNAEEVMDAACGFPSIINWQRLRQEHIPGRQNRLWLECGTHARCADRRELSERHRGRFGEFEVMGYLAVWQKRAGEYAGASQHIRCCKPISD